MRRARPGRVEGTGHAPAPEAPPQDMQDYVRAAARLLDLPLDDARRLRVAVHLERTRRLVTALLAVPLPADAEPAEVFLPAPFPEPPSLPGPVPVPVPVPVPATAPAARAAP